MAESTNNSLQWVLAGSLLLIGLFVIFALVGVRTQADVVSTSANVTNSSPTVDSVFINDTTNGRTSLYNDGTTSIDLTPGGQKTIHVNGAVSDANGVGTSYASGDIDAVSLVLRRSGASGGNGCTPDKNDCYTVPSCAVSGNTPTSLYYDCSVNVEFFADSTSTGGVQPAETWVAFVEVADDSASNTSLTVSTVEVGTKLALQIPSAISYGTLARAQQTTNANNFEMSIQQFGNDGADVEVSSAAAMTCTVLGTIPVADQQWALTDVSYDDVATSDLTGSAVDTNLAVGYRTSDGSPLNKILYWNIEMPVAVSGTCTGTTTITTIAS